MTVSAHSARVVIEALRAGVPNGAAIRMLGSIETAIEERFTRGLESMWDPQPQSGLAVAGGFGTGKSHLLGCLREVALRRNVVVSRVTVSKETPLSHFGVVFAAAMRDAIVPGSRDEAITAVLNAVQGREGALQELESWAGTPEAGVAEMFAAVAHLLARQMPPELTRGVEAFLCGGKPPTPLVRQRLAELGARGMFDLGGVNAATLELHRPRFIAALIKAAGFAGWCVLIDEVELIGRYGPAQRARAYVQLARWLGLGAEFRHPGLFTACAISDDFADEVINARQDDEKLIERLREKGLPGQADMALAAIRAIEGAAQLHAPDDDDLRRHSEIVRRCYSTAYDWEAPAAEVAPRRANWTLRHHVRGWIIEWDLLRLQGTRTGIAVSPIGPDYGENPDVVAPPPDDGADV